MPAVDAVAAYAGAWIGRAALDATLRGHLARPRRPPGGSPALPARALDRFGPVTGLPAALQLRPDRAGLLASSAPDVAEAPRQETRSRPASSTAPPRKSRTRRPRRLRRPASTHP
ncbi:hypothetical protein ADK34_41120 [Streptomyces viridochromogenes]|uniref:Uncharacterized protein n=1 Tax=Streptomyces viridochromogenes TaxID=1938 RepID=A0A0L8IZQ2_STRVR|nr:hypothetical protein ADK34_41120 [Streptomyces viridochromogenes]